MRSCSASTLAAKSSSSWDAALTDCPTQDWASWCTFAYERYFSWPFFSSWPFFLGPWTIIIQMEGAGSSLRKTSILWQNITWGGHRVLFWYVSQIVPSHSPASFFIHCWIDEIIALSSMWSPIDFGKTTLLLFAEIGKALATYWTCIGDSFLRSHKKLTVKLLACEAFLSISYTPTLKPLKGEISSDLYGLSGCDILNLTFCRLDFHQLLIKIS